jgi:hypothetical protein
MEKRYGNRHAIRALITLHSRSELVGTFITRDVAYHGMFVETGETDLQPHDMVWLDIHEPHLLVGPTRRLLAVVAHRNCDGVGVMFRHPIVALTRELTASQLYRQAA